MVSNLLDYVFLKIKFIFLKIKFIFFKKIEYIFFWFKKNILKKGVENGERDTKYF